MSDPVETFVTGVCAVISAAFGVGVTFATMRSRLHAAELRSETAIAQAQDALARLAVEKERSTKQDGKLDLHLEKISNLRKDVDDLLATVFRSRFESNREMQAARARPDVPRQDSDPVPPIRPMARSVRRGDT